MKKSAVLSLSAPAPIGPYVQAVKTDNLIFCSGQIGLDPASGDMIAGGVAEQTSQALRNLEAVLDSAGSSLGKVVKTTVFLKDMDYFREMNAIYASFFGQNPPARSTIEVCRLPKDALVEVECIATI